MTEVEKIITNKNRIHFGFLIKNITFVCCAFILFMQCVVAQSNTDVSCYAKLDTNVIVIGDQINLQINVEQPKDLQLVFPIFSDSIVKGVEIIKQTEQDTTMLENGAIKLSKNYTITSFESGLYKIKPFQFQISGNQQEIIHTDTLFLGVQGIEVDTTKGNFDVVMPIQTPVSFEEIAPWLLGGFLGLALLVFVIWFFWFRPKERKLFFKPKIVEPAHVIALRNLDRIKQQKHWQKGKLKLFHSELTDVIRTYFDQQYQLSTQESTTDEILRDVREILADKKSSFEQLKEILERADLVKFAKFQALPDENERSLAYAYQIVEKTMPIEKDETENKEIQKTQQQ